MPVTEISPFSPPEADLAGLLPVWAQRFEDLQTAIPELAKNPVRLAELDSLVAGFQLAIGAYLAMRDTFPAFNQTLFILC